MRGAIALPTAVCGLLVSVLPVSAQKRGAEEVWKVVGVVALYAQGRLMVQLTRDG